MATATAQPAAQPAVVPMLPFTAGSHEHTEPAFVVTQVLAASDGQINPQDVPAAGYARHVLVKVTCSGGVGGTIAADGPWNIIKSIGLQDVNGANIVGPFTGWDLYVANIVGGYAFNNNPANSPFHVAAAPNPVFYLRVPIEISQRDGLGALANQASSSEFKLALTLNNLAAAFSVAPTTAPTVKVEAWLEGWTLPAATNNRGEPQAQVPPLLGTGQFWTKTSRPALIGNNNHALTKIGNYVRNLVLIGRDASGVRSNAVLPNPLRFVWDGNNIHDIDISLLQAYLIEKVNGALTYPVGVIVLPFSHFLTGRMGNETPDGWLPTTGSSRIEISGNATAAGSVDILVNEVAPVEFNPANRFVTPNRTGTVQAA